MTGEMSTSELAPESPRSQLEVRLLGNIDVRVNGESLHLSSVKQRSILCLLARTANRIVPTTELEDELWFGSPPVTAASALRVHVSGLRAALAPAQPHCRIVQSGRGYRLDVESQCIDVFRFATAAESMTRATLSDLNDTVALWRGEPFDGADSPRLREYAEHLNRLMIELSERRFELQLEAGQHHEIAEALADAVRAHPYRERLVAHHMVALYRCGRQTEALAEFEECRRRLAEQLGLQPSPQLAALQLRILEHQVPEVLRATGLIIGTEEPGVDHDENDENRESGLVGKENTRSDWRIAFPSSLTRLGGPIVGRVFDRSVVRTAIDGCHTKDAPGRVVIVTGVAGIGKSRLLEAIGEDAGNENMAILHGWFSANGPAFEGVSEMLRPIFAEIPEQFLNGELAVASRHLERIVPTISFRRSGHASNRANEVERLPLFEAVHSVLDFVARRTGAVLVLDDVHWADVGSLELLRFLGRRGLPNSTLLVLAARTGSEFKSSYLVLDEFAKSASTTWLDLGALGKTTVMELVREVQPDRPDHAIDTHADYLLAQTAGIPLLIAASLGRDVVRDGEDGYSDGLMQMPRAAKSVLEERLRSMREETVVVLRHASVSTAPFGPEFCESFGFGWEQVADALNEGVESGVLVAVPASARGYRFGHEMWREHLYSQLTARQRISAHAVAGAFANEAGPMWTFDLAYHSCCAVPMVDIGLALVRSKVAAEQAVAMRGFESAGQILERALALEDDRPASFRKEEVRRVAGELKSLAGRAWALAGDSVRANRWFYDAFEIAVEVGDYETAASVVLGLTHKGLALLTNPRLTQMIETATVMVPHHEVLLRLRLSAAYIESLDNDPDWQSVNNAASDLVRELRTLNDATALSTALVVQARRHNGDPDVSRLVETANEVCAMTSRLESKSAYLDALDFSLLARLRSGNLEETQRALDVYEAVSHTYPKPWDQCLAASVRSTLAMLRGDRVEAHIQIGRTRELGERYQTADYEGIFASQMFVDHLFDGSVGQLLDAVRDVADHYASVPAWRCALGLSEACAQGAATKAVSERVSAAVAELAGSSRKNFWLTGMGLAAEFAFQFGDAKVGRAVGDLLHPYADQLVVVSLGVTAMSTVDHYAGLAHAAAGDLVNAETRLRNALRWADVYGARACEMDTAFRLGEVLRRLGSVEESDQFLQRAVELANTTGYLGRLASFET
jgi:DNA-binding SARP family transcriptional activator/tetratricopeptide (TPR) repeat protein